MSSQQQGHLRNVVLSPALLRRGMNLWPPFLGAGIKVTRIAADYREVDVSLRLGVLNRNYLGTQFGGSLFAMTDPFFVLMMLYNLGPDYVVWDKTGTIEYLKPGRGTVHANIRITEADLKRAVRSTAGGPKHEPTFHADVVDDHGVVIARIAKTLYIRRKAASAKTARPRASVPRATRRPRS